jgi:hypothetical protein
MRDRRAAAIYAADKLANMRELLAGHKTSAARGSITTSRPSVFCRMAAPTCLSSRSFQRS